MISAGRTAVERAGSVLDDPVLSGSLLSVSMSSCAATSPAGAPGPLATPNSLAKTVVVVGPTGVALNISCSISADVLMTTFPSGSSMGTFFEVVVPTGVSALGSSVSPVEAKSIHLCTVSMAFLTATTALGPHSHCLTHHTRIPDMANTSGRPACVASTAVPSFAGSGAVCMSIDFCRCYISQPA